MSHTPGPWKMSGHETTLFGAPAECISSDTIVVAVANPFAASHGNCQDIANARLIAAAPDLLQLLKELIDIEGPQPGHVMWANKVKAAIAKATGAA